MWKSNWAFWSRRFSNDTAPSAIPPRSALILNSTSPRSTSSASASPSETLTSQLTFIHEPPHFIPHFVANFVVTFVANFVSAWFVDSILTYHDFPSPKSEIRPAATARQRGERPRFTFHALVAPESDAGGSRTCRAEVGRRRITM